MCLDSFSTKYFEQKGHIRLGFLYLEGGASCPSVEDDSSSLGPHCVLTITGRTVDESSLSELSEHSEAGSSMEESESDTKS